jgi:hypothetical protein
MLGVYFHLGTLHVKDINQYGLHPALSTLHAVLCCVCHPKRHTLQVKGIDQYGRNVAACSLKPATPAAKAEDINAAMVANGHATAYRYGLSAGARIWRSTWPAMGVHYMQL